VAGLNAPTASFLAPETGLLPQRRRVPVLAVVIALHVLLILLLLLLAPPQPKGKPGVGSMVAVNIAAPTPERAKPTPQRQPQRPPSPRAAPQPEALVVVPNAPPSKWSFGDPALRGFDISKVPQAEAPALVAAGGPPDSAVVGVAPDGSKLYAAEWQREPTDAELAFYLRNAKGGNRAGAWGLIACRTVARFKVEDCRATGESPGSGLGYAVQEAAWQFRVKPPRIDGQYQVGTWVSIRIDIRPGN